MKTVSLFLIKSYQLLISPIFRSNCRFYPSCSNYAYKAIEKHGNIKGYWLTFLRLTKCHPFHNGGIDHVPN